MDPMMFADVGTPGDYLVVEDPEKSTTWHLRVKRNGTLDRALAGAAYAALTVGYRGNKYGGPNAGEALANHKRIYASQGWDLPGSANSTQFYSPAQERFKYMFSEAKGDTILRTGKIFAVGDYPSHGFQLSLDEALDAIQSFTPQSVDLEHASTMLDGKLGQLVDVGILDDNETIVGTWAQPRWLADVLGQSAELTVSTTWLEDDGRKRIGPLALTTTPAVPDAVLFSRFMTFAGQRHSAVDMADMQSIHDLAVRQGANCSPAGGSFNQKGGKRMGFFSKLLGGRRPEDVGLTPEQLSALQQLDEPPEAPPPDPRVAVLEQQLAAQATMFSEMKATRRREKAQALVDGFIREGKLYPYERNDATASLERDMEDDELHPAQIQFTDARGQAVSRTREQARLLQFSSRVPHGLTTEQVKAVILPQELPPAEESEEARVARLAKMLAMTHAGKEALAEFSAKHTNGN